MLLTELLDMFELGIIITRDLGLWYVKIPGIVIPHMSACDAKGPTPNATLNAVCDKLAGNEVYIVDRATMIIPKSFTFTDSRN